MQRQRDRHLSRALAGSTQALAVVVPITAGTRFLAEPLWRWMDPIPGDDPSSNELRAEASSLLASVVRGRPVSGRRGLTYFSADQLAHLDDVARLIRRLELVAGAVVVLTAVLWAAYRLRGGTARDVASDLAGAAKPAALGAVIVALVATVQWGAGFRLGHEVLFPSGNWSFSSSSALTQSYPLSYFEACSAVVLAAVAVTLVAEAIAVRRASRRATG